MPLTQTEIDTIDAMLLQLNAELNKIISAREDVSALLRIVNSVNNDTTENNILVDAKLRAKAAAQNIVTLLT